MKLHAIFTDQRGFTMIEVLAAAVIILVSLTSMYIGVVYADKSLQRSYHTRCANLIAAGELDWQYYYLKTQHHLDVFSASTVFITYLPNGRPLNGTISMHQLPVQSETVQGVSIPHQPVEIKISWREGADRVLSNVVMRGDFFAQ